MTGLERAAATTSMKPQDNRRIPGEPGIWALIAGDLFVFTTFFATYLYYRANSPELFAISQESLSAALGTINTIILLSSSLLVALAVKSIRQGNGKHAPEFLAGAFGLGLLFVASKAYEWGAKIAEGMLVNSNEFFMFYYMFTGIHLLHVLAGMAIIALLYRDARSDRASDTKNIRWFEVGATFWHLVDLLWIVIFTLLYLVH
jgi:nitric oxide reductase NorE protein